MKSLEPYLVQHLIRHFYYLVLFPMLRTHLGVGMADSGPTC
jgi:hypothetical protein